MLIFLFSFFFSSSSLDSNLLWNANFRWFMLEMLLRKVKRWMDLICPDVNCQYICIFLWFPLAYEIFKTEEEPEEQNWHFYLNDLSTVYQIYGSPLKGERAHQELDELFLLSKRHMWIVGKTRQVYLYSTIQTHGNLVSYFSWLFSIISMAIDTLAIRHYTN